MFSLAINLIFVPKVIKIYLRVKMFVAFMLEISFICLSVSVELKFKFEFE